MGWKINNNKKKKELRLCILETPYLFSFIDIFFRTLLEKATYINSRFSMYQTIIFFLK